MVQQAIYAVSTYAVLEVAQEVFHIGAGFSKVRLIPKYKKYDIDFVVGHDRIYAKSDQTRNRAC